MISKPQCVEKLRELCFTYDQELLATRNNEKNAEIIYRAISSILKLVESCKLTMIDSESFRTLIAPLLATGEISSAIASAIWSSIIISVTNEMLHVEPTLFDRFKLTRQALQTVVRKSHEILLKNCKTSLGNCPSCGALPGHTHIGDCTIERCSVCGKAHHVCRCAYHDKEFAKWMGSLPGEYECIIMDLTIIDPQTLKSVPNMDLFMALGLTQVFFIKHAEEPLNVVAEHVYKKILERQKIVLPE